MPVECWLQDSLVRVFPTGAGTGPSVLHLEAARGERVSLLLCVVNAAGDDVTRVRAAASPPRGIEVRVRRVGFVPLARHTAETEQRELDCRGRVPGFVPDPLFEEQEAEVARGQRAAFWVTAAVSPRCPAGRVMVPLTVEERGTTVGRLHAVIFARDTVMPVRTGFPVFLDLRSDAIVDWYGLPGLDARYWRLAAACMENLAAHGADGVSVPLLGSPQLLSVTGSPGALESGWKDAARYVALARSRGIRWFDWQALPSRDGEAPLVLGRGGRPLWPAGTPARSAAGRAFLSRFLPRFRRFLESEKLLDCSVFRFAEPHGPCSPTAGVAAKTGQRRADPHGTRQLLHDLAPWMRMTVSCASAADARGSLADMPAADMGAVRQLVHEGVPCMGVLAPHPRGPYPARWLDTPLAKVRAAAWLSYRFGLRGLFAGDWNDWHACGGKAAARVPRALVDPFTESCGGAWPAVSPGERFFVYPGPSGPLDSIRWEAFAEGLADYALLSRRGVPAGGRLLAAVHSFHHFPQSAAWLRGARRRLS
jgi:hypothetical protein